MTTPTARPLVWGHRGAMAFAPQNTLPSFLLAADQGADGVELDVQLTRDGTLVVFHDGNVDALTDGHGPLAALTWREVSRLDAGSHFGQRWAGTRIPTLEAVLTALPARLTVNIELKTSLCDGPWYRKWVPWPRPAVPAPRADAARREAEPLARAVLDLIAGDPSRYLLSSFDPFALEACQGRGVPLGFLHAPDVPWDTPQLAARLRHEAWHPHNSQVTRAAVGREHAAGRRVHVWTVNDARRARRLASVGVDALITNRPGELVQALLH